MTIIYHHDRNDYSMDDDDNDCNDKALKNIIVGNGNDDNNDDKKVMVFLWLMRRTSLNLGGIDQWKWRIRTNKSNQWPSLNISSLETHHKTNDYDGEPTKTDDDYDKCPTKLATQMMMMMMMMTTCVSDQNQPHRSVTDQNNAQLR